MPARDIICLANSHKHGGRCVAGLAVDGSGWVRPVGKYADGTLEPLEYSFADGSEPQVLDVLRVGLLRPRPQCHQPENWLVDQSEWSLLARPLGAPLFGALKSHVVHDENLLGGPSDRVAVETFAAAPAKASLALVAPETVVFRCQPRPSGVPQVRGRFCLGPRRVTFDLAVTDPRWEKKILQAGRMTLQQGEQPFLLTISLGEPYRGFCYKLIAAVIPLPPELARHVAHGC